MNDYQFWEEYLKKIKKEIEKLCKKKDELYIDLHMHSNYSADGKQTLDEIIKNTKKYGFDIIAITDHDDIRVYDELYNYVKLKITNPIIIPGVEFTINNREYGNQCHLLQLFINPKDKELAKNININYDASFNRSKKQFIRLKENITINQIINEKKIKLSYNDYIKYLKINDYVPEYDTLCFYLIDKFKDKNVTTFQILDKLETNNLNDCYNDRMELKKKRYEELRNKYEYIENNFYNARFLLSMLAVREVDDDWWDKPSSGSLSVNDYGQLKLNDINNNYDIYFAHPNYDKLDVVDKMIKAKNKIVGVEMNIRNFNHNHDILIKYAKDKNLFLIKGSDSHDNLGTYYNNMDFFKIKSDNINKYFLRNNEKD